jgi:uncharacterized protein (DUF305 family)
MKSKYLIVGVVLGAAVLVTGVAFAQMHGSSEKHGHMSGSSNMHSHMQAMMHGGGMQMQGGGHGMMHDGSARHGADDRGGAHAHGAGTAAKGDQGPSSLAFQGVNAKMHKGMDIAFSGDADRDFIAGMLPHHQGAVDMAKIVLGFGKDPEVRKLAESIIKAQEQEIAWMNSWLQKTASK